MKKIFTFLLVLGLFVGCRESSKKQIVKKEKVPETSQDSLSGNEFAIVIHGGAGSIYEKNMSDSLKAIYHKKLEEAVRAGYKVLENGGRAVDAVRTSIRIMENSPLFNAGKGAVFTYEGTNELDASIMMGKNLMAGAVAGVNQIKNPIDLAYQVMVNSPHVMLYGDGAEAFAKSIGMKLVDPSYFYTQRRYESLQQILKKESKKKTDSIKKDKISFYDSNIDASKFGTVGCVALDKHGNIAAGTSTGGMTNKRWNRIGDSPIIGAGTYANNKTCGVSCTGWGEYFIRGVAAYSVSTIMEYGEKSLSEAAQIVIHEKLPSVGGGGLISIDSEGHIVVEYNTPGMFRAYMDDKGNLTVGMF